MASFVALRTLKTPLVQTGAFGGSAVSRLLSTTAAASSDEKLFDRILIANRGEIACRVIRTCRKLGIESIAVHSDADSNAVHVREADRAYRIGPAPSSQSYLNVPKIVEVIQDSGAQAVHPGYGFLSENNDFCGTLEGMGVAFIGPKQHAISVMGDKLESKVAAAEAKVNVIPGFEGEVESLEHALEIANQVTYPIMIKASAGGGGKGMRVAWNDDDTRAFYDVTKSESLSSFGDDRLLIEKYIDRPRHIEFQVLADAHGNAVYLNERECSIQRRNQKVIEEAPSVFLDPELRKAMGEQAIALAKAVDYQSAGTVEFLVDANKNFYFLEMNTRLQVEHPITELISGVDLVEQMIRVAAGHPLTLQQSDIGINGWAVESRIYAEDPKLFLPSTGRLTSYIEPTTANPKTPGVRVDSGVCEGSEISIYYDAMISKLVTHAPTRQEALDQMAAALDSYVIQGVNHNIPLVRDVITHDKFIKGDITTAYLEETYPTGFEGFKLNDEQTFQLVAAAAHNYVNREIHQQQWMGAKPGAKAPFYNASVVVSVGDDTYKTSIKFAGNNQWQVTVGDKSAMVQCEWRLGAPFIDLSIDGKDVTIQPTKNSGSYTDFRFYGSMFNVAVRSERDQKLFDLLPKKPKRDTSGIVVTPMPGTLLSVDVEEGQEVLVGQQVAVVEAMKMQNQLPAPKTGIVKKIHVKVGDTLGESDIILEFEDDVISE